jgi:AHBA synthesis associated protein
VATGKGGSRARALLDQLGILSLFDHVIGADEVARPKPAADILVRALGLLGVRTGEAVMVGDAASDIICARSAGVVSVAALWGESDRDTLLAAGPDIVLDAPADLLRCLPARPVS